MRKAFQDKKSEGEFKGTRKYQSCFENYQRETQAAFMRLQSCWSAGLQLASGVIGP